METIEKNNGKLFLYLPLLLFPFLCLGFYALGGGTGYSKDHTKVRNQGINTNLPDAKFDDRSPQDKLSLYDEAARNSPGEVDSIRANRDSLNKKASFQLNSNLPDLNEQRINDKLALINREINRPANDRSPSLTHENLNSGKTLSNSDVDRLELLMNNLQKGKSDDRELQQLSSVLDKIATVQNPDLARQSAVQQPIKRDTIFRAIPAMIDQDGKVSQGGMVKLILLDTMTVNGITFPKNQLLFGLCNITNQRLLLDITNIRIGTAIIPVNLSVFSLDGMIGIDAPEAELGEAAGNGADNALQSMQFLSMDQSIGTQAAGAGINVAKGLFGKKVKRVRVKLKKGKNILLRNNQRRSI